MINIRHDISNWLPIIPTLFNLMRVNPWKQEKNLSIARTSKQKCLVQKIRDKNQNMKATRAGDVTTARFDLDDANREASSAGPQTLTHSLWTPNELALKRSVSLTSVAKCPPAVRERVSSVFLIRPLTSKERLLIKVDVRENQDDNGRGRMLQRWKLMSDLRVRWRCKANPIRVDVMISNYKKKAFESVVEFHFCAALFWSILINLTADWVEAPILRTFVPKIEFIAEGKFFKDNNDWH